MKHRPIYRGKSRKWRMRRNKHVVKHMYPIMNGGVLFLKPSAQVYDAFDALVRLSDWCSKHPMSYIGQVRGGPRP